MMKTIKDTRNEESCQNRADAPAVPTGRETGSSQGWEGTRERRGNNWGNRFDLVFSSVFISLLVFVPLFSLSNSLFKKRRLLSKTYKKTKSLLPICTSSLQERGTREQSAFEPGFPGLFVFPGPRERSAPSSLPSPERRSPCPVH
jgi:hypothetical protein